MLPKNLKYGSKVESANCKSYRTNIQPQNGTGNYGLGDTITINIPTRRNLVMVTSESYWKFTIAITNKSILSMRKNIVGTKNNVITNEFYNGLSKKDSNHLRKRGALSGCYKSNPITL